MNPKVIVIDGKTYHSVEEMPEDIREKYQQAMRSVGDANNNQIPEAFETLNILADQDQDGVPDVLENLTASHAIVSSMTLAPCGLSRTRAGEIVIDGKQDDGLENLPPEARARYEEAMGKLDANRNGIPDVVEGMFQTSNQTANSSVSVGVDAPRRSAHLPVSPTITPDTSNGWMLVLAGLLLLGLCVFSAAGVWYFFLR
jgi:hypothetical protein